MAGGRWGGRLFRSCLSWCAGLRRDDQTTERSFATSPKIITGSYCIRTTTPAAAIAESDDKYRGSRDD